MTMAMAELQRHQATPCLLRVQAASPRRRLTASWALRCGIPGGRRRAQTRERRVKRTITDMMRALCWHIRRLCVYLLQVCPSPPPMSGPLRVVLHPDDVGLHQSPSSRQTRTKKRHPCPPWSWFGRWGLCGLLGEGVSLTHGERMCLWSDDGQGYASARHLEVRHSQPAHLHLLVLHEQTPAAPGPQFRQAWRLVWLRVSLDS